MANYLTREERGFLEDLEMMRAVSDGAQYPRRQILDVSGALYRQLLDKKDVTFINGGDGPRVKLEFRYREFPPVGLLSIPPEILRAMGMEVSDSLRNVQHFQGPSMNPERTQNPAFPNMPTVTGSLKNWRAHTSAIFEGERISVAENIRLVRHVLGGGHYGTPETAIRESLTEYQEIFELIEPDPFFGPNHLRNGPTRQIVHIAGVTAAGLQPLADALLSEDFQAARRQRR